MPDRATIRQTLIELLEADTGEKYPDLADRMWTPPGDEARQRYPNHGYDFWADDDDPFDEVGAEGAGHGTACAGLVAGDGSLGTSTGVAPGAQVMAVRVGGAENQFWRGLQFAIDNGARVFRWVARGHRDRTERSAVSFRKLDLPLRR